MVLSMTGFGRAEGIFENKKISIDLRAVNSKSLDLNLRLPSLYKEKEFIIRKKISEGLVRGKVDTYLSIEHLVQESQISINKEVLNDYISQLKAISPSDTPEYELLKIAMRLPDTTTSKSEALSAEEWLFVEQLLAEAIAQLNQFRTTEGQSLQADVLHRLSNIQHHLKKIAPYEKERLHTIEEKYKKTLQEFDTLDETRFYQEMAYYTEKLDISEEKVRLAQHLKYYQQVLEQEQFCGKKLGFIAQEIGREINTLGSKSNHAEMQKLVVLMKDDLEKIKEQTLNIL